MELKELQAFTAVVEYGSFSGAANALHVSQPTISDRIQSLERELNTILLDRTTKKCKVTKRGQELYECAGQMLRLRNNLLKRWRSNSFQVGASPLTITYALPALLSVYSEKYPEVSCSIVQQEEGSLVNGVQSGIFDVALLSRESKDPGLESVPFCRNPLVLITPGTGRFSPQNCSLQELLQQAPLVLMEDDRIQQGIDMLLKYLNISWQQIEIAAHVGNLEAAKNLVAGGLGISILPACAVLDQSAEKRVLQFDLPKGVVEGNLYIVCRKDRVSYDRTKEFIALAKEVFA